MADEWWSRSLAELASLHQVQVNPADTPDQVFEHYSLPAFDGGQVPVKEPGSSIGSHKFTIPRNAILLSKLNPRIPRVWKPVDSNGLPAVASTEFLILLPKDGIDRTFLKYVCLSPAVRDELEAHATGTSGSHQRVRPADALNIEVNVPSELGEQRAISHILGTLDDKIELNRRMSETLEAMARALFKSWFVDFDPVRAKMEGRDPGLPKPLANLFPARLVDSELGKIPEGWEVGAFADVAELLRDQVNPLDFPDTSFLHFSLPSFDEGQWPKEELGQAIKSQKSRLVPGVVLISKLNPEIERVWLVDIGPDDQALCSTEFLVLRPQPPVGRALIYCLARSPGFRQGLEGLVTGTSKSHQRAQAVSILALHKVRPSVAATQAFERQAEPVLARSLRSRRESRTLAALRDALLPKLISGELRVEVAERLVQQGLLCKEMEQCLE